ncbi:MAG: TM2 domain-containing protein [Polyangiaceae bacterium]|nr:TM2 domain-containing protein [Polyangiaceae bacterium]
MAWQGGGPPEARWGIEPMSGLPYSDKEKMVAFLLEFLLAPFGAGRFYTGHTGIAIAQIAVSWLTCGLGTLWPVIDSIMMAMGKVTDSEGRPLRG